MFDAIEDVVGEHAALILCARFGGQRIMITRSGLYGRIIAERLGQDVADKLALAFKSEQMTIPMMADRERALRNREMREVRESGATINSIARQFNMTERNVRRILSPNNNS